MGKSYKSEKAGDELADLLSNAKAQLQDLQEECQTAADNFPNDSHPKAQAFSEAASALGDALDHLDGENEPGAAVENLPVPYWKQVPRRRAHHPSKAIRASNIAASLCAAATELEEWCNTASREAGASQEVKEEALSQAEACQSAADVASGVDFPGMFG